MTTQLELKNVLEQNPLELAKPSAPAFLTTALKNIGIDLFNAAQDLSDKFRSISVHPISGASQNFVIAPEGQETSTTEVLTPKEELGEEIKNEVVPSALFRQAALEKTQTVIAAQGLVSEVSTSVEEIKNEALLTALSQTVLEETAHSHSVFERIKEVFTEASEKIEALEIPAEFGTLGFEWSATIVELVSHHAGAIAFGLEEGAAFLGVFGLVAKINKVYQIILVCKEEGAELPELSKLASLGFSIAESLCKTLYGLSHIGIISHAIAAVGRLNLIGAICYLVVAVIGLGDNIITYKGPASLLKALFNAAVAIAILVLIVYTVSHLNILLLILGTGIFLLNVAIPDEEEHEVKQVH